MKPPAFWQQVLGQRASFWVSAGVVTHIFWTSAAPAMTYRLYAEQWHLTPTVTTGVFAVYPIVVVAVLVGFGDLSDHIGRRLVMLLGLGASLIGTLLFAVAPDVLWLFAGRAFDRHRCRPDRRHFDGSAGGLQRRGTVEAGRVRHHRRPGLRLHRGSAAGRCADAIRALADPSGLLGPVRPDRPAVCRDLVPAAPPRWAGVQPLASEISFHTGRLAVDLRGRGERGDDSLYAWRADPVAWRAGRPRSRPLIQRPGQRRRAFPFRDHVGRGRDCGKRASSAPGHAPGSDRLRCQHGPARPVRRPAGTVDLPRLDGDRRDGLQPACRWAAWR